MSSAERSLELFLVDTLIAIEKVKNYTKEFTSADDLKYDELHWDATIRELEIIGEALNNLLKDTEFTSVSPDYFRKIVNFRNAIAHGYFGIVEEEVWDIITEKLDILKNDLLNVIKNNFDITEAIQSEVYKHKSMINYFNTLDLNKRKK